MPFVQPTHRHVVIDHDARTVENATITEVIEAPRPMTRERFRRLADKYGPPQSWFDE